VAHSALLTNAAEGLPPVVPGEVVNARIIYVEIPRRPPTRREIDPGWRHRTDEALGVVSFTILLGTACGGLIGNLGVIGGVLAAHLFAGGMWLLNRAVRNRVP
jgi:hypothetical protein